MKAMKQMLPYKWTTIFVAATFGLICPTAAGQTKVNLARQATGVRASVDSEAHPVAAVNDASTAAVNYWSSWSGKAGYGQEEFVELEWNTNCEFLQAQVYWAEAGDSILLPAEARLATWDGHQWQQAAYLAAADSRGVSTTDLSFTTNRVRLYMKSSKACGVRELRLFGYKGAECSPAILTASSVAIALSDGQRVTLAPTLTLPEGEQEPAIWNWTLPDGSTATTPAVEAAQRGVYTVSYQRSCGNVTSLSYTLYDPAESYTWPKYKPTLSYDYRSEYPALEPPTKFLPEQNNQKGYMADGWWAIAWGPKTSRYVTETAKKNLLDKMNTDFAYFRDVMGWPPDKRARNGYYSTVYVFGSGLGSDNADSTATGGWQGATWHNGSSWPMVYISYYPIACFDPAFTYDAYHGRNVTDQVFQQNACVHEGIHAIFADLEGCKQSAWYQEAGNTWLQAEAEVLKTGKTPTSMGFLSAGNMIAPFMPIECYSGWLLDGAFGGPSAEGVNMYNSSGQVCTWRNLLGGVQYGELFPHFVSEILGRGSIPWIWRYCKSRVLEGMADSLGERQMRHLVMEYRSRQAMIDVGAWSNACRKLLDDNWLVEIKQEWSPYWKAVDVWKATPYVNMYRCDETDSAGWWKPEYRTTPGWSGANQIPLHVNAEAGNTISVHFKPLGRNMVGQLAYRTKRGRVYYSRPVEGEGDVTMTLKDEPANGVVIAIVCNTDYIYEGDETRKRHFDYRLCMGQNVYQPAKAQLKWYNYRQTISDNTFTGISQPADGGGSPATFTLTPGKASVKAGHSMDLHFTAASQLQVQVRMYNAAGAIVHAQSFMRDGALDIPAGLSPGVYLLQAVNGGSKAGARIVVE
jgi:hypothetical protein